MKKWMLSCLLVALLAGQASADIIPMGNAIGISMQTDGVVVVSVERADGAIRAGDIILEVNGKPVSSAEALREAVQDQASVALEIRRDEQTKTVELSTRSEKDGTRLGLYVRDQMAGIGTLTYYDTETRQFGALGHGISEQTSGQLLPLAQGELLHATVTEVTRGEPGAPGRLGGTFDLEQPIGTVTSNTDCGIFGELFEAPDAPAAELAMAKEGPAQILATVDGDEVRSYDVQITGVDAKSHQALRLTVTDPELLKQTGGIVQGVSGAPIMQDGKLVGAVTHVLVEEPDKGYGILIEDMLEAGQ